jgi:hypothetical protein
MSGPKIVLLFLIVFAVIFAFAISLGFLHPDDNATANNFNLNAHPVARSFAGLFASSSSVPFHVSGAGCPGHTAAVTSGATLTVAAASPCTFTIAAAGRQLLILSPPSAQSVSFQVATGTLTFAGDNDLNKGAQTWAAGNGVKTLTVRTGGGQLNLACGIGTACELRIK